MAKKEKNPPKEYYPSSLTIAGSDSSGGAGIEADLRTFNAFGVYGCAAITAITAQNPEAVTSVDLLPGAAVAAQIDAVMAKVAVRSAKTGMLGSAENVEAVVAAIKKYKLKTVCDPVIFSTSKCRLQSDDAVRKIIKELLPLGCWVTPNIPEASYILGKELSSPKEYAAAAQELAEQLQTNVLLKGGHDDRGVNAVDYVCYKGKLYTVSAPKLQLPPCASHGTGCTMSAAMAALTALTFTWDETVLDAKAFVFGSLRENVEIGEKVFGMYPPTEDTLGFVEMKEYASTGKNKAGRRS